ncbi:MAG TPA: hypothetical protein VHJ37_05320 [Thermoleophilaceae bacterium]|jgi:hypothetical protein|nr:hypothetical protein [Thermoleophilaceae bacterium]
MDSPNVLAIKDAWQILETAGPRASMEKLLELANDDVEARPYSHRGVVLHGPEEIRAFVARYDEDGTVVDARADEFEELDDEVIVRGSIRVVRADGSFAETQVRWHYRFDGTRLDSLGWEPRAGELPALERGRARNQPGRMKRRLQSRRARRSIASKRPSS